MKVKVLALIAVLMLLFSFNISAATYEYDISTTSDFTSVKRDEDMSSVAQKLNMTADELSSYFKKNSLLYLAVSNDTKTQIRLSAFTDNFSSTVSDISYLANEQLTEFMNAVSDDENDCEIVTNGERKYITLKDTLSDSGGVYTVTQYITICDSQTFYLSCYNEGNDTSDEIENIFKSFTLNASQTRQADNIDDNNLFIFIILGIAVFAIVALVMLIGIIKSFKKSKH